MTKNKIDFNDSMFSLVTQGKPGFFHTIEHGISNIRKIVREENGELWSVDSCRNIPLSEVEGLEFIAAIPFLTPAHRKIEVDKTDPYCKDCYTPCHEWREKLADFKGKKEAFQRKIEELESEIERLKGETSCAYCCVYCGTRFLLEASDAKEQIGQHIATCPKHPMRVVEGQRDEALIEGARLKAEVLRLENKLNADSQNFTIECLRAEVAMLRAREKTNKREE